MADGREGDGAMTTGSGFRKKLKRGLRDYLAMRTGSALIGYSFVRGMRAGLMTLPSVAVHVVSTEPDLEDSESRVWKCVVDVAIRTKCDYTVAHVCKTAEDAHDAAVEAVEGAIYSEGVQGFLNSESTARVKDTSVTAGTFTLTVAPSVSSALLYAITAADLQTALRATIPELSVCTVTATPLGWLIDRGVAGVTVTLTGSAGGLTPGGSEVIVNLERAGTVSVSAQWHVVLAATAHAAHPTGFYVHTFEQGRSENGYQADAQALLTVLTFEMGGMEYDGDQAMSE